eukprot:m.37697 g.37697  ORF g.37697 m.37697 type:complete len:263 (-) comp12534_c0_seq5:160-948(-)
MDVYHSLKAMGVFDYWFFDELFFACLGGLLLARLLVNPFVKSVPGIHFFVKVIWFAGSVAFQVQFLADKPWIPFYMGGPRQFDDPNFWVPDTSVDIIYKIGFAFHLHNAIADTALGAKMAFHIHHIVTLVLIVTSHACGYQHIGACVFIVHDIPDVFTALTKALIPFKITYLSIASGVCLLVTWAVCRLYLLSWMVYDVYLTLDDGNMPPFVGMLATLECLHIHWFILLIKILINFKGSGNIKDVSEPEGRLEDLKKPTKRD